MAAFGFRPEDFEEEFELWAPLEPAFAVFESMTTQWRIGMNGATGLDYSALPAVMDMLGLEGEDRSQAFRDVRVMEREALAVMAESRE
ncbi:MAG TPA: DUF1799 domain-containing protein [Pseudomonas oryzihabitans]|nr:DUF1799 domain-containing protein [Pseudomonas oryzihabitans]HJE69811.1 DUF1799 domain-containing protein [Pseudomonas oryzihabitans]